jgi:polysaccharide export outer membrane protein
MARKLFLLIASLVAGNLAYASETKDAYLLKEGDVVEVSVWREDTLKRQVVVLPDGSITFPLAGRVEVAGLNIVEAAAKLAGRLANYISDPQVTIVIGSTSGNRIYVLGNVNKPGPIMLDTPMTVLQALSLSGGLGKFADEDAIKVLRVTPQGQEVLPVRYNDLIKARDLSTNRQLKAGDTILVP